MNHKNTLIVGCLLASASPALATPGYEDLALGSTYYTTDATASEGLQMRFFDFQWYGGSWTPDGEATVGNAGWSCNPSHELGLNNINVVFDYAGSTGPATDVKFDFGEHGGNVNFAVNGDFYNEYDFMALDGKVIGGAAVTVVNSSSVCGTVRLSGHIESMMVGGQELWIDDITSTPNDPCQYGYEDVAGIMVGTPGDTFTTEGIDMFINGFQWSDGTWHHTGQVNADSNGYACSYGQELELSNASVLHDFAGSIGPLENVSLQFGEYGGNINVEINGDLRNVNDFRDLDGMLVGGVMVSIPYGGNGNDCGKMTLTGTVDTLGIGGRELWIDCLEGDAATSQPGDTNGDGSVDVTDLLNIIQGWGYCTGYCLADLNNDQLVNVMDLLITLENWG